MNFSKTLTQLTMLSIFLICSIQLLAHWTTIKNGASWMSTNGNVVKAHGAGFLKVGDKWFMAGEDRSYSNAEVNL